MNVKLDRNPKTREVFTTGAAAVVCRLSQHTIIRSIDSGQLIGFKVPGSSHRRIARSDLLSFMRTNKLPLDLVETENTGD